MILQYIHLLLELHICIKFLSTELHELAGTSGYYWFLAGIDGHQDTFGYFGHCRVIWSRNFSVGWSGGVDVPRIFYSSGEVVKSWVLAVAQLLKSPILAKNIYSNHCSTW